MLSLNVYHLPREVAYMYIARVQQVHVFLTDAVCGLFHDRGR